MAANGPVWIPQALNPLCLALVGRIPFSHFPGVIRNWHSPAWKSKDGKFPEQNWLKWLQMVQFESPRHWNHSSKFGESHFPFSWVITPRVDRVASAFSLLVKVACFHTNSLRQIIVKLCKKEWAMIQIWLVSLDSRSGMGCSRSANTIHLLSHS